MDGSDAPSDEEQLRRLRRFAESLERGLGQAVATPSVDLPPALRRTAPPSDLPDDEVPAADLTVHTRLYRAARVRSTTPPPVFEQQQWKRVPGPWDAAAEARRRDLYLDAEWRRREQQQRVDSSLRDAVERSRRPRLTGQSERYLRRQRRRTLADLFCRHAGSEDGQLSYEQVGAALEDLGFFLAVPQHEGDDIRGQLLDKVWAAMAEGRGCYVHCDPFVDVLLSLYEEARRPQSPVRPAAPASARSASVQRGRSAGSEAPASRVRSASAGRAAGLLGSAAQRQHVVSQQLMEPLKRSRTSGLRECTFSPCIGERSKQIATERRKTRSGHTDPAARVLFLCSERQRKEQKLAAMREARAADELEQCTFKPAISTASSMLCRDGDKPFGGGPVRGNSAFRTDARVARRAAPTESPAREAAEPQCTFKPNINSKYAKPKARPLPNGFWETIRRLKDARFDSRKFEDRLRERAADLGAPPRPTVTEPFRLQAAKERQKPLVTMDVQLRGRRGRIDLAEGDSAAELARSFAATHALDRSTEARLRGIIEQHLCHTVPQVAADRHRASNPRHVATAFASSAAQLQRLAGASPDTADLRVDADSDAGAEEALFRFFQRECDAARRPRDQQQQRQQQQQRKHVPQQQPLPQPEASPARAEADDDGEVSSPSSSPNASPPQLQRSPPQLQPSPQSPAHTAPTDPVFEQNAGTNAVLQRLLELERQFGAAQ